MVTYWFGYSQNHKMVEVVKDIWRSFGPRSCSSEVTYNRLLRTMSRWLFSVCKDGGSTSSLGKLFQCSVTLIEKRVFPMFWQNLLCFRLCLLFLMLPPSTTEKNLARLSLHPPFRYYIRWWDPLWAFLLWSEHSQLCQPFLIGEML